MASGKRCGNQGGGNRSDRGDQTQVRDIRVVASSSPGTKNLVQSARVPAEYPGKGGEHVTKVLVASTLVVGKVIDPPKLKLSQNGRPCEVMVKERSCDWKYSRNCFAEGKKVERWALINLSSDVPSRDFIEDLQWRSRNLGMDMEEPEFTISWSDAISNMDVFSSVEKLGELLQDIFGKYRKGLQIIIFIMTKKHDSYGYLKWVLETKIGLISQVCLEKRYSSTTKTKWAFFDRLCMKINGKIGGSNVELIEPLPHGSIGEHVMMLIGAGVNHPEAKDETSPSVAAVVGTVNWPAANRYVAKIKTQTHGCKRIVNFGAICKDLVNTFSEFNKVKPDKIVVFRDSDGHEVKLDKVVNREFRDLEKAICTYDYKPSVTLVLVQKSHHTQIYRDKGRGEIDNVLPGTVVDSTAIVHQGTALDFYLCSHYNGEASKPVHYRVLRDQNSFPPHDLQKLIYHLCFTDAAFTKPVSPVPPVRYANLAAARGRMYYEAANLQRKVKSDAATSSSTSSANPSAEHEDCCRLHPDLANEMFFI